MVPISGQISQVGAQILANKLAGNVQPYIGTSAPTWVPGLEWINTTSGACPYTYNGSSYVAGAQDEYIALLTASPFTSGAGGGYAQLSRTWWRSPPPATPGRR